MYANQKLWLKVFVVENYREGDGEASFYVSAMIKTLETGKSKNLRLTII